MALMCSFTAMAQFTFPLDTGMYQTTGPTPVVVAVNDAGNAAGVPAGVYETFTVTYDWSDPGTSDPWSSEEELDFTTTAGTTNVDPPTSGGATSGASTTLTFSGAIPGGAYDPSVDGFLELGLFRSYSAPADITNISVTITPALPAPNCAEMPISPMDMATDVAIFGGELTLTWTAPSAGPPPTAYEFFLGDTPGSLTSLGTTTDTFIDLVNVAFNAQYYWQVVPLNGAEPAIGCAEWTFTTEMLPPPPSNNDCANATPITPGAVFSENPIVGTNVSATDSGETPLPSCSLYDPIDPEGFGGDVWYSVTVPADGNLTIETNADPTGTGGDTGMSVYTGSCGALAELECDDDDSPDGFFSQVVIEPVDGLANQVVYIRIFEYSGNNPLAFQISAYSATLSNDSVDNEASFSYYPNPVKNTLTLNAQNNIETVRMYNMLGQEVMNAKPQTVDSELDMSSLETGTYFVQVTIANVTKTVRVIKQ